MTGFNEVVTVVVADAEPVQPLALVTVTVKVFAVLTEIVCVVAPVDQLYVVKAPAFNVVELPEQKDNVPLIDGDGAVLTVMVLDAEPVHPFALVTVTVNVPAVVTEIVCVVAPVDQLNEE